MKKQLKIDIILGKRIEFKSFVLERSNILRRGKYETNEISFIADGVSVGSVISVAGVDFGSY